MGFISASHQPSFSVIGIDMANKFNWSIGLAVLILALAATALGGCASSHRTGAAAHDSAGADRIVEDLTPAIETLYLHWHELDQIHKEIKFLERGLLADPDDRQLGYVQKISLYIQDASLHIHHGWERLSVLGYVRPEMMRDYVTLNVKSLGSAMAEMQYDLQFIEIYRAFVDNPAITAEVEKAHEKIALNREEMRHIVEKLTPLTNPATSPTL
jgi:hypothetical protein